MAISKERIGLILSRFSLLFPAPVVGANQGDVLDVWFNLFADTEEAPFIAAARALALSLRRFPCPADFVDAMAGMVPANTAKAATENVAQGV